MSVSIDAASAVSMTGFSISELVERFIQQQGQSLPVCIADEYQPDHKLTQIVYHLLPT